MTEFAIFTDGGCQGNPGPGAWAFALWDSKRSEPIYYSSGYKKPTTNNEMEVTAILEAAKFMKEYIEQGLTKVPIDIVVYSDSSYCVNSIEQWMFNWMHDGSIHRRPNGNLFLELYDVVATAEGMDNWKSFHVKKVPGHSNNVGNNYIDRVVNITMDNQVGSRYVRGPADMPSTINAPYIPATEVPSVGNFDAGVPGIRFAENYNKKLDCEYFTTIRPANPDKFKVGNLMRIELPDQPKDCYPPVRVVDVFEVKGLNQIDDFIIFTDSGKCPEEFVKEMKKFYPDYSGSWYIVLLKKVR